MRHSILLGLTLTAASCLSLISYHAGTSGPTAATSDYALAITTGQILRLASPETPVGQRATEHGDKGPASRTLSCAGVIRLGMLDVGYACAVPGQAITTGSL